MQGIRFLNEAGTRGLPFLGGVAAPIVHEAFFENLKRRSLTRSKSFVTGFENMS